MAANGTDFTGRIIDAPGRRPILANLPAEEIAHFRTVVEMLELIGCIDAAQIIEAAADAAERTPGATDLLDVPSSLIPTAGYLPAHMAPDPAGYFVIYPDTARRLPRLKGRIPGPRRPSRSSQPLVPEPVPLNC